MLSARQCRNLGNRQEKNSKTKKKKLISALFFKLKKMKQPKNVLSPPSSGKQPLENFQPATCATVKQVVKGQHGQHENNLNPALKT